MHLSLLHFRNWMRCTATRLLIYRWDACFLLLSRFEMQPRVLARHSLWPTLGRIIHRHRLLHCWSSAHHRALVLSRHYIPEHIVTPADRSLPDFWRHFPLALFGRRILDSCILPPVYEYTLHGSISLCDTMWVKMSGRYMFSQSAIYSPFSCCLIEMK